MVFLFILVLMFSVGRFVDLSGLALSTSSPIYTLFTFHFLHMNGWHLCSNIFLFVFYWRYIRWSNYRWSMPIIVCSSLLAACMSRYDTPTVGCSAIIMAMAGVLVATLNFKLQFKNAMILLAAFAITSFMEHINTSMHLWAFFSALLLARCAGNKRICRRR